MSGNQEKIAIVSCIDYRYDALVCVYLNKQGLNANYYNCATAGAGLPLGYSKSCKELCGCKGCKPCNSQVKTLRESLNVNISISIGLSGIKTIYVINHQDCGAFKVFLGCSGYPETLGSDNQKEIDINAQVLTNSKNYLTCKNKGMNVRLGVVDMNGSVADYNPETKSWVLQYTGAGTDPKGLWYGMN